MWNIFGNLENMSYFEAQSFPGHRCRLLGFLDDWYSLDENLSLTWFEVAEFDGVGTAAAAESDGWSSSGCEDGWIGQKAEVCQE